MKINKVPATLLFFLLLSLTLQLAFADNNAYHLEDYLEEVIKNDLENQHLLVELKFLQDDYQRIKKENSDLATTHQNADEYVNIHLSLDYLPIEKQVDIKRHERRIKNHQATLLNEATTLYINHQKLNNQLKISDLNISMASKELDRQNAYFHLGHITSRELKGYEEALLQANRDKERSVMELKSNAIKLNQLINIDIRTEFICKDIIEYPTTINWEDLDFSIDNQEAVIFARETLYLAELKYGIFEKCMWNHPSATGTRMRFYSTPSDWQHVKNSKIDAEKNLTKTLHSQEILLKQKMNSLLQSELYYNLSDLKYSRQYDQNADNTLKYHLGLIDLHAMEKSELLLEAANLEREQAGLSLKLKLLTN